MAVSLREWLGIDYPIIQAPMAGVQDAALAIAVSNAGGLGSLPCALLRPAAIRSELERIRSQTGRPYNVNFFCHQPPALDEAREAAWRNALAPYFRELGLDPAAIPAGPARAPFDAEAADIVAELKPPVVSFHFGLPAPALLERVRGCGAKILSSATTVDEARWLEANGADAIIAQGLEAGGHRGMFLSDELATQVRTMTLLPRIIEAVHIPVIAAGAIVDAATVRAAMALGAAGVQVGTAYLLCPEATTTPLHRNALKNDAARETALTNVFTGRPARGIVNRLIREAGPMSALAPAFPMAAAAVAPLRAKAESLGRTDFSPLWSGENANGCREISAADLTRELAAGFRSG